MKFVLINFLVTSLTHFALAYYDEEESHGYHRGTYGGSKKKENKCFQNSVGAAALANKVLANFWADILETECETDKILKVYDDYFTEDASVVGTPLVNLEMIKEAFVLSGVIPGLCANNILSWYTSSADVSDCKLAHGYEIDSFVWKGNEYVVPLADSTPQGREYTFQLDGKKCDLKITQIAVVGPFPTPTPVP